MKKFFFPERKIHKESCHFIQKGKVKVCGSLTQNSILPRGPPKNTQDFFTPWACDFSPSSPLVRKSFFLSGREGGSAHFSVLFPLTPSLGRMKTFQRYFVVIFRRKSPTPFGGNEQLSFWIFLSGKNKKTK